MALLQINSKCEDRMQDEYTIPVCGGFYRIGNFVSIR